MPMLSVISNLFTLFTIAVSLPTISYMPIEPVEQELQKRTTHTGRGTWFYPGMGNCGQVSSSEDPIVAIPKSLYDQNRGSNCGQWISIKNLNTGHVAYGRTADSCPGCGSGDLDMSPHVFEQLASLDEGEIRITWSFLARGVSPPYQ